MLCRPEDLSEKNQALLCAWQRYASASSVENFGELAVSINSFTEFLIDKGVVALHHASHELEQTALTFFSSEVVHPLPAISLEDLKQRILDLTRMVELHLAAATAQVDRRLEKQPDLAISPKRPWLVAQDAAPWQDLLAQLGHFGMDVGVLTWDAARAAEMGTEPMLLLDLSGIAQPEWAASVQSLRQRFPMGRLLGLNLPSEFDPLQQVLRGGCDACVLAGTPLHGIVEQIMELNQRQDQEAHRVLIVEDSKTASHLIRRTLEETQTLSEVVNDPRQTLKALKQFNPDLILMDMYMPNCTGVEVARVIRQYSEFLSIPIVYLSGETDVALQVDAMRLGGDHFLTKPFNPVFLNAIVKTKIDRYRALRRTMYHDSLTGLLNHTSGKSTLDSLLSVMPAQNAPVSVVMMDIDHFKQVNDTYGHPIGDQVIRSLSWLLKQRLRKQDVLCRYGGEEFLIVMPHTEAEQAFQVMDRIRQDFAKIRHPYRDTEFHTTVSGGVSVFPQWQTADVLIKAADEALYQAKRAGRNRIQRAG